MKTIFSPRLKRSGTNQKGASIIAVIAIMLILAVMGAALVSLVTTGSDVSVNQLQSEQALHVAEGGLERALDAFYNNKIGCNSLSLTSSLGSGSFTTSGTPITSSATTLRVAIGNGSIDYIQVFSTAGYEPAGRIWIDSEQLTYKVRCDVNSRHETPYAATCL